MTATIWDAPKKAKKAKINIPKEKLQTAAELTRALAHPLRLKILKFIDQNGSINVNKIYNTLKLEQSITSQHLAILRRAGIVETDRQGKFIYYSIDYERLSNAVLAINNFLDEELQPA